MKLVWLMTIDCSLIFFPKLADSDLEGLSCEVTDDEIKNKIFAVGGLKTSGPDGFPALFY